MLERYVHGVLFNSSCLTFTPPELLAETAAELFRSLTVDLTGKDVSSRIEDNVGLLVTVVPSQLAFILSTKHYGYLI